MKYNYFLFDWDGSLGATLPLWFKTFKETFSDYGIETNYKEIGEKVLGDWDGPRNLGITNVEEFFGKMETELMPKLPDVQLNPGVKETLEKIKKAGGKIGVVTTSKKRYVKRALKNNGLSKVVDVFLGKEDVENYKPDPEILFKALNFMGGKPSEAIMVGDTSKDIEAAKRAGMASVLYFPDEYHKYYDEVRQKSLGAMYVIKSFQELEKFL